MLVRFSVQNFRSYGFKSDLELQPVTALFGGNGSGKSNLLAAIRTAVEAVLSPEAPVFQPFLLREAPRGEDCGLELETVSADGARFRYGLSFNAGGVTAESLEMKPEGDQWRLVLARADDAAELSGLTSAAAKAVLAGLAPDRTAVPLAGRTRDPALRAFRAAVSGIRFIGLEEGAALPAGGWEAALKGAGARRGLAAFLACLDPEVSGCRLEGGRDGRTACLLRKARGEAFSVPIPLAEESAGIRKAAALYFVLQEVLGQGGTAVIDGLSSGLHPLLEREVIRLFASKERNPRGAQLLFSTHDAWVMAEKALSKESLWLVEKASGGASGLKPLSRVAKAGKREGRRLSSAYLKGKLGGVPQLRRLEAVACESGQQAKPLASRRRARLPKGKALVLAPASEFLQD